MIARASAIKAITASMSVSSSLMTLEVLSMGLKAGLGLSPMLDAINGSSGRTRFTEHRLAALACDLPGNHSSSDDGPLLADLAADMERAIRLSQACGTALPLASAALGLLLASINHGGPQSRLKSLLRGIGAMTGLSGEGYQAYGHTVAPRGGRSIARPVIGYVGLGAMGSALARRALLAADRLIVSDVVQERVAELVQLGATEATDLAMLARESDIIMLCVPTSDHVRSILFEAGGMLGALAPGKIVVDQTTGSPFEARQLAERLGKQGIGFIDAPVAGGPASAGNGTLLALCGGTQNDYAKVLPLLETMGRAIYFGEPGGGQTAKLVKNATGACNRFICYESIDLARRVGIELAELHAHTRDTDGWTAALTRIADAERTGESTANITARLFYKDLRLVSEMAMSLGAPLFLANAVRTRVEALIKAVGPDSNIDALGLAYGLSQARVGDAG